MLHMGNLNGDLDLIRQPKARGRHFCIRREFHLVVETKILKAAHFKNLLGTMSPRACFLIFSILVVIIFIFLLDLIGVHVPYTVRYPAITISFILYVFLIKIKEKLRHTSFKENSKAKQIIGNTL